MHLTDLFPAPLHFGFLFHVATMPAKPCAYCYGHGLYAAWWDMNVRWVIPKAAWGKMEPAFEKVKRYACDRCKLPKGLPLAPPNPKIK